jgi:eukaryotic-like serine/threonine-protein kinase
VLGTSIASNTGTGVFLGTPFYASPEQAEGIRTLDHRTDIWSIGVIAFECLIGRQPFVGDTFASLVLAICSRPMPVPSQHGPVPPGFDAWFARACARDVEQRFQSVRDAASALRQVLEPVADAPAPTLHSAGVSALGGDRGQALSAPPLEAPAGAEARSSWPRSSPLGVTTGVVSSSTTTRRRPVRRSPRVLALSGLAALALLAVVVRLGSFGGPPESEPPQPEVSPKAPAASAPPAAASPPSPASSPLPAASVSAGPGTGNAAVGPSVVPVLTPVPVATPPAPRPQRLKPPQDRRSRVAPGITTPSKVAPVRTTSQTRPVPAPVKIDATPAASAPPAAAVGEHGVNLGF